MTDERKELLGKFLYEDLERAKKLTEMSPEDAAVEIKSYGFDFTADELVSFAEDVEALRASMEGELSEDDLDDVAGGGLCESLIRYYMWCYQKGVRIGLWVKKELQRIGKL